MPWNMNMPWTWIREHKHTACTTSRAKHAACTNATNADNSLRCEHKKWLKAAASATKTSWQLKTSQAPQTTKTMKWMGGSAPQTPAPAESLCSMGTGCAQSHPQANTLDNHHRQTADKHIRQTPQIKQIKHQPQRVCSTATSACAMSTKRLKSHCRQPNTSKKQARLPASSAQASVSSNSHIASAAMMQLVQWAQSGSKPLQANGQQSAASKQKATSSKDEASNTL